MHTSRHRFWRGLGLTVLLAAVWSAVLLLASGSGAATFASSLSDQNTSTFASLLYDQNNRESGYGMWSTVSRDAATADDFVVPAGASWQIGTIKTTGLDQLLTSVTVTIYSDSSNAPGTPVYTTTLLSGFSEEPGPYPHWPGGKLTIPVDVTLTSGHYWLSVQGERDSINPYFWHARTLVANHPAVYRGPGVTGWVDLASELSSGFGGYAALDLQFALYGPGPLGPSPSVSLGSVQAIGARTATLTGTVNPHGFSTTDCRFAYGEDVDNRRFNEVPCKVLPGSGTSDVTVSATLTGLSPNTLYSYALLASTTTGSVESNASVFTTDAERSQITCVVPKVKGKTLAAARKAITKAHCSVGKITKVKSSNKNKGHVVSQSPKPGKHLTKGAKVALKVGR